MKETFLHHIFYQKLLGFKFKTTAGEIIEILDFGQLNKDSGPDFSNVKLRYDNKIWFGPLEFHIRSSDWYRHKHQNDERYKNVIAHFVYEHDLDVHSGNYLLPTVELKEEINEEEFRKFEMLISKKSSIKCSNQLEKTNSEFVGGQIEIAINQRLRRKSDECGVLIEKYGLEKAFYIQIATQLGSKVNAESFRKLITQIDLKWIARLNYNPLKIEALLLGIAGLIPQNSNHAYILQLKDEYNYTRQLLNLNDTFSSLEWKYSTMRPANFPDIRIAQLSAFLAKMRGLSITGILSADYAEVKNCFGLKLNSFWENHYRLDRKTKSKKSNLSSDLKDLLIINGVNPIAYYIGERTSNQIYIDQVMKRLKLISPENNYIIRQWNANGIFSLNALESQALIETKNEFCNEKKCLFCAIGKSILNK